MEEMEEMEDTTSLAHLLPPSQQAKLGPAARAFVPSLLANRGETPTIPDQHAHLENLTARDLGTLWPLLISLNQWDNSAAGNVTAAITSHARKRELYPLMDQDTAAIHFSRYQDASRLGHSLRYIERPLSEEVLAHLHRLIIGTKASEIASSAFHYLFLARSIDARSEEIVTQLLHEACGGSIPVMREFEAVKTFDTPALDLFSSWAHRVAYNADNERLETPERNEAYAGAAREMLCEALERIETIHGGKIPYVSDAAFDSEELGIIARAAYAAAAWQEPWFGAIVKRLFPLVCVAPTEAKTVPSQSLGNTLAKIIAVEPSTEGVQALREALRVVRHAGLAKKLQRHLKPAERALIANASDSDALVPNLGLDESGSMRLDFGPRHFSVGFDENLAPHIRDAAGVRLKALPKPNKSDDAQMALTATERYQALKKDLKAVAAFQIARLENAMAAGKRWPLAQFQEQFVGHPLLRHLAARLAWSEYVDGQLVRLFRIAEDWSFADHTDAACTAASGSEIGIAHALSSQIDAWQAMGQVFGDYAILQPFRQFGRETYHLEEMEKTAQAIARFKGKVIAFGSIMGLQNRGWKRIEGDGKWVQGFEKRLPGGKLATMEITPGYASYEKIVEWQTLGELTLAEGKTACTFAALDALAASELLREFELIRRADA